MEVIKESSAVRESNLSVWPRKAILTGLIAGTLTLSGCASTLSQLPAEAQITAPGSWESVPSESAVPLNESDVAGGWVATFGDESFEKYAQIALENNPDLRGSAAQLKSAIEQVTISGAAIWPSLSVGANRSATDTETDGFETKLRTASAALDIAWEADIWGKLTQRKKASAFTAKAQSELYRAAELSLVANVGRAWYNVITNKLQVDLAQQRLESFQRTADLIEENYQRGLRSALDVYLSRSDVQVQISGLADAKFIYLQSLRAFNSLLGSYPDSKLAFDANLPELSETIPVGLPAQLLERRPDVQASQFQYKSAIASAKAAQRDRFPSLTLTGSIGDSRNEFDELFENDNIVKNILGGLALPLFQAGALKARSEQAAYQAEAAYASLVRTTISAFEEVENAINLESSLKQQNEALKKAVDLAQGGLDLALDRYQSGIENYQTVLQSQRSVFSSKQTELNVRNALLQNRITLFLALGGDFGS
ncbi:MAG: efflux transporter outer membrane subunit [Pseudomonadota bacterium]